MEAEFDFVLKIGPLKLTKGHLKADLSNIGITMATSVITQAANNIEGTGMAANSEMAPAIKVEKFEMSVDARHSHISITGGVSEWCIQTLSNLFRRSILYTLTKEATKIVEGSIENKVNTLLKEHGTHLELAGYGLDFSQLSSPQIANDTYFNMYMNGTFFSEQAQAEGTVISSEHKKFELGSVSKQDIMMHIPETFMTSFINAVVQTSGGLNITEVSSLLGIKMNYGDLCRFNLVLCQAGPA